MPKLCYCQPGFEDGDMPGKHHARCPSDRYWFPAGSVALGAVLLSALLPSLGYARNAKQTARPLSVRKQLPKCAPTESAPEKDVSTGSAASSNTNPQSTDESRIQDSPGSDSMKLESSGKDDVQTSEPECAQGQSGTTGARCQATKPSKDSASQCARDPGLKPDLTLDREPAR
jgi:hypothetical protein